MIKDKKKLEDYLLSPHSEKIVFNEDGTWHPLKQGTFPSSGFTIGTRSGVSVNHLQQIIEAIESDIELLNCNETKRYAGHNTQYLF